VVISTLTLSYITAMLYLLMRRKPVIRVLFTEDGLVVHRGAGVSPYLGMWLLPATWSALRGRVGV
jgi:hypothetical protein